MNASNISSLRITGVNACPKYFDDVDVCCLFCLIVFSLCGSVDRTVLDNVGGACGEGDGITIRTILFGQRNHSHMYLRRSSFR